MLIYEFRDRVLQFKQGSTPTFPAQAKISAALAPRPPFGGEVGVTRSSVRGVRMRGRVSPSTGRFFFELDEPLFEQIAASSKTEIGSFSVNGHIVSVESRVESLQHVADLLGALCYVFPSTLNLVIPDSPYTLYAWGEIGGAKFQWHFHPKDLRARVQVTSQELQEEYIIGSWAQVELVRRNPRMLMSLHYFRVACRLLLAGQNRFEFMAEAVLNLAKCLQSLCGESRDDVRVVLDQLGISPQETEALYIPALILRNEFAIAHVNLEQYKPEQLRALHIYVDLAEPAFRRLLRTALERFESGDFAPKVSGGEPYDPEKAKIIKKLEDNLRPFQEAAADEAVYLGEGGTNHSAFDVSPSTPTRREPPAS